MTIYIAKMYDNWNADYAVAYQSLEGMAKEILERMEEENLYPSIEEKELVKAMKFRAKKGYEELLAVDDDAIDEFQDRTGFMVQAVSLEK